MRLIFWGAVFGFIIFRYVGAFLGGFIGYILSMGLDAKKREQKKFNYRYQEPVQANTKDSLSEAYETLGVSQNASLEEVRRAYRQKCKALHPDTLSSKKLNDIAIKTLEKELRKVVDAYELILKSKTF